MFNFGGAMLTGSEIERQIRKGNINITPYNKEQMNPNSYNLRLHPQFLIYQRDDVRRESLLPSYEKRDTVIDRYGDATSITDIPVIGSAINSTPIDMRKDNPTIEFEIPEEGYVLQPGVLYIARTVERISTDRFVFMLNGRSSIGRLGMHIHVCAGFGDLGFDGTLTLEIVVTEPLKIYPNIEIAQVCFFKPAGKVDRLYRGRYYHQIDATASRFYKSSVKQLINDTIHTKMCK